MIRTLLAYPFITKAFNDILVDSYGSLKPQLSLSKVIPESWHTRFDIAERILRDNEHRMYLSIPLTRQQRREIERVQNIDVATTVGDLIITPVNNHDQWVLEALGYKLPEIAAFKEVMEEFFDGELSEVFRCSA